VLYEPSVAVSDVTVVVPHLGPTATLPQPEVLLEGAILTQLLSATSVHTPAVVRKPPVHDVQLGDLADPWEMGRLVVGWEVGRTVVSAEAGNIEVGGS
jgi:hypothetical protein